MRKLGLAALLLFPLLALAAGGINLALGTRAEFTACASGGSSATTLVVGEYLMRVTDADTFVCFAETGSTCASGGEKFPAGTVVLLYVAGDKKSVSCRSSASTGDVIFTASR